MSLPAVRTTALLLTLPLLACGGGGSGNNPPGPALGPATGTLATQCGTTELTGLTYADRKSVV